jgi:hypothetical protein
MEFDETQDIKLKDKPLLTVIEDQSISALERTK